MAKLLDEFAGGRCTAAGIASASPSRSSTLRVGRTYFAGIKWRPIQTALDFEAQLRAGIEPARRQSKRWLRHAPFTKRHQTTCRNEAQLTSRSHSPRHGLHHRTTANVCKENAMT